VANNQRHFMLKLSEGWKLNPE